MNNFIEYYNMHTDDISYVTKEIIDFIFKNIEFPQTYDFQTSSDSSKIETFINNIN